jgi:phage shock protein E
VHTPYIGEVPGTDAFIPFQALGSQKVTDYPADKHAKIMVYCRTGFMANIVARELVRAGYTNIWNLDGGMDAWTAAGFELTHTGG